jgi:rubredoxin
MPRLTLTVRCSHCGHEFDTGIRMEARDFARATFAANYHVCPACGRRGTYRKGDYKIGESTGSGPAASNGPTREGPRTTG